MEGHVRRRVEVRHVDGERNIPFGRDVGLGRGFHAVRRFRGRRHLAHLSAVCLRTQNGGPADRHEGVRREVAHDERTLGLGRSLYRRDRSYVDVVVVLRREREILVRTQGSVNRDVARRIDQGHRHGRDGNLAFLISREEMTVILPGRRIADLDAGTVLGIGRDVTARRYGTALGDGHVRAAAEVHVFNGRAHKIRKEAPSDLFAHGGEIESESVVDHVHGLGREIHVSARLERARDRHVRRHVCGRNARLSVDVLIDVPFFGFREEGSALDVVARVRRARFGRDVARRLHDGVLFHRDRSLAVDFRGGQIAEAHAFLPGKTKRTVVPFGARHEQNVARLRIRHETEIGLTQTRIRGDAVRLVLDVDHVGKVADARLDTSFARHVYFSCGKRNAVASVDAARNRNDARRIDRIGAFFQGLREFGRIRFVRGGTVLHGRNPLVKAFLRRNRDGKASRVDDARGPDHHAARRNEVEVAPDLSVLEGVHRAVHLDPRIDEVQEPIGFAAAHLRAEMQIGDVPLVELELIEPVDAGAVLHLLRRDVETSVGGLEFRPAGTRDHARRQSGRRQQSAQRARKNRSRRASRDRLHKSRPLTALAAGSFRFVGDDVGGSNLVPENLEDLIHTPASISKSFPFTACSQDLTRSRQPQGRTSPC